MLQTVRAEKKGRKSRVLCPVEMFPFWVMVLKLSKNVHFLQFFDELSRKSEAIEEIYIYTSERSVTHFLKMVLFMTHCFWDIRVWSWRILLNFSWATIVFDILIANISWTMAETSINQIIFWKSVMRNFRCIYVIFSNGIGFIAEISTKLKNKCTFLDNLRTITQE